MGATTGDNLPWPELGENANVPQDMQELATATQTALDKKMPTALSKVNLTRSTGWTGANPSASKSGKIVLLAGYFQRTSDITISAQNWVTMGTAPAGYRPASMERFPVMFYDNGALKSGGFVAVGADGVIEFLSTTDIVLQTNDFVEVSVCSYVTP